MVSVPKFEGYRCKKLRCFKPIFKEWIKGVSEIVEEWKSVNDVPWWYNERASLSVFAGAIWRAGGFCFEEYSEMKRHVGKPRHRLEKLYSGRVDIYFSKSGIEFIAESKHTWSGCTRNKGRAGARLQKMLGKATNDIRQTKPFGQRRLGIVFAMPYFLKTSKRLINENLPAWIEELDQLDTTAYAWVFPKNARFIRGTSDYCPGVAVLIKQIKR